MPDSIDEYLQSILEIVAASPIARSSNVILDRRTLDSGLLCGDLYFADESRLHFRELIEFRTSTLRVMYSFHYQQADGSLIFRYDDTPHHSHLAGPPYHKHVGQEDNVIPAPPPDLESVLSEIEAEHPLE